MPSALGLVASANYQASGGAWTPVSLPGLAGWYDPSNLATITAVGGKVSQIADLSGLARHAIQGTGAQQPTTGTHTIGGLNALRYGSTSLALVAAAITGNQPVTIAGVVQYDAGGLANSQWWGYSDIAVFQSGGTYGVYAGSVMAGGTVDTTPRVWVAVVNGAVSDIYLDGSTSPIASGNPGPSGINGVCLGGTGTPTGLVGTLGEVVWTTGALGVSDRTALAGYLKTKWGTP